MEQFPTVREQKKGHLIGKWPSPLGAVSFGEWKQDIKKSRLLQVIGVTYGRMFHQTGKAGSCF